MGLYEIYEGGIIKTDHKEAFMMEKSKRILAEALELSPIERASLIEELLSSFNFPERKKRDMMWAEEVEDRINAYERGEILSSPAEDVYERIEGNVSK